MPDIHHQYSLLKLNIIIVMAALFSNHFKGSELQFTFSKFEYLPSGGTAISSKSLFNPLQLTSTLFNFLQPSSTFFNPVQLTSTLFSFLQLFPTFTLNKT